MKKKTEIIGWSSTIFWVTLGIILFFLLPYFKNIFYKQDDAITWLNRLKKEEINTQDSTFVRQDSIKNIYITWVWEDFNGENHEIGFNVNEADKINSQNFREGYSVKGSLAQLYADFIDISSAPLDSMYKYMLKDIRKKGIAGQDVLDYVVTAIQFPKYTKISHIKECPCWDMNRKWEDDCQPNGCCNEVIPIGLYTPAEFIIKKTGDCDTKALIAYALLKRMGYDSSIMVGDTESGPHAMLGVSNVRPVVPTATVRYKGKIYYPWEVTSFNKFCKLGNVNMWSNWRNWEVICN